MVRRVFAVLLVALAVSPFWLGAEYLGAKRFELTRNIAGSTFEIVVYDIDGGTAGARVAVEKAFDQIRAQMEAFAADGSQGPVALDEERFAMVKEALRFSSVSGGAYDPADGALRALWGKAKEASQPPSKEAVGAALKSSGSRFIKLDEAGHSVTLTGTGARLSFKEIAAGFAMERAAASLKKSGARSAVIANDGTVLCVGIPESGRVWRVAIEHPRSVDTAAAVLEIEDARAVATLGDYDEFFMRGDKRFSTVVDPRTGLQPEDPPVSVTAVAPSAVLAKVLARAFFVLGADRGFELVEKLKQDGAEVICLEASGQNAFTLASSEGARPMLKEILL